MKHAREDAATRQWVQRELTYVTLHEALLSDDRRSSRLPGAGSESAGGPGAQTRDIPAPDR
jgi:hypothetical protein